MTTTRFRVAKMDCGGEEAMVRMSLDPIEGIEAIHVDLTERTVAVVHEADPGQIESALVALDLDTTRLEDSSDAVGEESDPGAQRRALLIALAINAAFFVGELVFGLISRSMGLVADSLDMGADAAVYALSLAAVGAAAARKKGLAATSGYLQLGLAVLGLVEVARRLLGDPEPPEFVTVIVLSLLALVGNAVTLLVLNRVRSSEAHMQASWIFTSNDIKVNLLVVASAVAVALTDSAIPDLVVGGAIFLIVANGARRILRLSQA